ncbi:MAG: lactonase family protein [Chloroflexi bacterium]|nr:lactonase family protein [Chloroflexota bacterium]
MKIIERLKIVSTGLTALSLCAFSATSAEPAQPVTDGQCLVYVGTYTGAKSKGIYAYRLDAKGVLTPLGLAAETMHPTFLAIHPNNRFLYAANETGDFKGTKAGAVSAFSIDSKTGKLTLLNQQSAGGSGPCHLVVDRTGQSVLVANYGGGSVAALPVREDGRLGEASAFIQHQGSSVNQQRQAGPHGHHITTDPANRFALACDLGLDKVLVYRFDPAQGSLLPNDPPATALKPGAGPRHLAFHPTGHFAYVINEMACTLTAFRYDAQRGELQELQTVSTLPEGESVKPNYSTAEVEVHPSGKFVYGSNRGHDSIVVFAIDAKTGRLTQVEHQSTRGKTPRNFGIDPTGTFLLAANQGTDNIVVFRIDPETGRLSPTGQVVEGVGAPVCVKFVPLP